MAITTMMLHLQRQGSHKWPVRFQIHIPFHLARMILTLIHLKNLRMTRSLTLLLMTNLPGGEVGMEPRSLYDRAVSATGSLTAK